MKRLNSIQFLRAIAIILLLYVNAVQLAAMFAKSHQQEFFNLRYFGYIGLDLFMVIAGFITGYIFYNYEGKKESLNFISNRFRNVNILYYIGTIIFMVFICFLHKNFSYRLVLMGLRDAAVPIKVLPQQSQFYLLLVDSWPITFLWIFYLLFATSIFLKIKKKLLFISAIIILLTIAGFYVSPYTTFRLKSVTSPILLEFLMGLSIFWLSNKQRIPEYAAYSFLLLGISGFIYNIFYGDNEVFRTRGDLDQIYELKRVLQFGVPSALLVAGSVVLEQKERLNKVWNNRFFQLTGNASYSIFLIYPSVYFLLMVFYVQIVGTIPNADLNIFMHMPVAWGIGILFYRKVECPIKEMIKNPAHYFAKG